MQATGDMLKQVKTSLGTLAKEHGDFMQAFGGLSKAAMADGALSKKTKELIAVALGVCTHCHWCIRLHVRGALDNGATREEVLEACHVATLMGGGPSLMYTQEAIQALDDLAGGNGEGKA